MRLTWLHNRNVNSDSDEVEMSRLIDADKLKAHYAWWKGGGREMTMDEAKNDFDTIIDLQPTVYPEQKTEGKNTTYKMRLKNVEKALAELLERVKRLENDN